VGAPSVAAVDDASLIRRAAKATIRSLWSQWILALIPGFLFIVDRRRDSDQTNVVEIRAGSPRGPVQDTSAVLPAPAPSSQASQSVEPAMQMAAEKLLSHLTDKIWVECRMCNTRHFATRGWAARHPTFPCDHCDFLMRIEGVSKKNAETERQLRSLAEVGSDL
jgi:hypothetical protein